MPEQAQSVFVPDGDRFVPTEYGRGPWDAGALHGGAPAALVARAFEREPGELQVVRVTLELLRPVPLEPLSVETRVARPGRRVQLLEACVTDDRGNEVLRASAWRIRRLDHLDLGRPDDRIAPTFAPPGECPEIPSFFDDDVVRFTHALEMRSARGTFHEPGPATVWFRVKLPIVAGEEPSPLQRVMAAADFGNGISSTIAWGEYLFINPDLTVYVHREPVGEWVALDALSWYEPRGVGLSESALYDEEGHIGRALQSVLLDRLPGEG
jgi:hypothetical protein